MSNIFLTFFLEKKYGNLCSRCKNSLKCSKDDKFYGKEGVLLCLTEGGGDIAWARLNFVRSHFKVLTFNSIICVRAIFEKTIFNHFPSQRFGGEEDYNFLCPDGSTRKLTDDPCIWFEEPWRTTIARK